MAAWGNRSHDLAISPLKSFPCVGILSRPPPSFLVHCQLSRVPMIRPTPRT